MQGTVFRPRNLGPNRYPRRWNRGCSYLRAPYQDQSDLPLFDTRPLTFSWGQLFRDNRYTGADRQTDANQLTMALSSRLIRQSDGHEKLSVSLGQIHYFRSVTASPCPANSCRTRQVGVGGRCQLDASTIAGRSGASTSGIPNSAARTSRASIPGTWSATKAVVNLSYRYRRDLLEQADLSVLYPVSTHGAWSGAI